MEQFELPLYDDCFGKAMSSEHKNMTALERFIYNWEPQRNVDWRADLAAVVAEAYAQ
jgi:hypothetical protein